MVEMEKKLNELSISRDAMEDEIQEIVNELNSPGINGEPPGRLKGPLVDQDGFPRGDIDIYMVRTKRHRFAVLQTDHKETMKQIEDLLPKIYASKRKKPTGKEDIKTKPTGKEDIKTKQPQPPLQPQSSIQQQSLQHTVPFAIIQNVKKDSVAELAGLEDGDAIVQFGSAHFENHRQLKAIVDIVKHAKNYMDPIHVVVYRRKNETFVDIDLEFPSTLDSLGCHIGPY